MKGNTAVYMLYAYTRISSISRKANLSAKAIAEARNEWTPQSSLSDWKIDLKFDFIKFWSDFIKFWFKFFKFWFDLIQFWFGFIKYWLDFIKFATNF